jgi:hypothetical protein
MGSILSVEQLRGLSSGDTPNTITLPTGQTLDFSAGTLTMPAGHVIQTIATNAPRTAVSSGSYTNIKSQTITPTSASSKILVVCHFNNDNNAATRSVRLGLDRVLNGTTTELLGGIISQYNASARMRAGVTLSYFDTPSTTNELTYTVKGNNYGGDGGQVEINDNFDGVHNFIIMEIAG